MSHSTAEAGELSPRDPVEATPRGHRQGSAHAESPPVRACRGTGGGKDGQHTEVGSRLPTSRQRIAELARQAVGMAMAIAWLPGPAGTRRRVRAASAVAARSAVGAALDVKTLRCNSDYGPKWFHLRPALCGGRSVSAFPRTQGIRHMCQQRTAQAPTEHRTHAQPMAGELAEPGCSDAGQGWAIDYSGQRFPRKGISVHDGPGRFLVCRLVSAVDQYQKPRVVVHEQRSTCSRYTSPSELDVVPLCCSTVRYLAWAAGAPKHIPVV